MRIKFEKSGRNNSTEFPCQDSYSPTMPQNSEEEEKEDLHYNKQFSQA
jgi:hypothetical protein